MKIIKTNGKGFTMMELVIVMFILSIMVLVFIQLFTNVTIFNIESQNDLSNFRNIDILYKTLFKEMKNSETITFNNNILTTDKYTFTFNADTIQFNGMTIPVNSLSVSYIDNKLSVNFNFYKYNYDWLIRR